MSVPKALVADLDAALDGNPDAPRFLFVLEDGASSRGLPAGDVAEQVTVRRISSATDAGELLDLARDVETARPQRVAALLRHRDDLEVFRDRVEPLLVALFSRESADEHDERHGIEVHVWYIVEGQVR